MRKLLLASCVTLGLAVQSQARLLTNDLESLNTVLAKASEYVDLGEDFSDFQGTVRGRYINLRCEKDALKSSCNEVVFLASLLDVATQGSAGALNLYNYIVDDFYENGDLGEESVLFQLLGSRWGKPATDADAAVYSFGKALNALSNVTECLSVGHGDNLYTSLACDWFHKFLDIASDLQASSMVEEIETEEEELSGLAAKWDQHFKTSYQTFRASLIQAKERADKAESSTRSDSNVEASDEKIEEEEDADNLSAVGEEHSGSLAGTTSNALVPAEAEEAPAPLTSPELEKLMAQQEALKARMEEAENELDEEKGPALVKARLEAEAKAASTEYENAKMMGSNYIPYFTSPANDRLNAIKNASGAVRTLAEEIKKTKDSVGQYRRWSMDENPKITEGFAALKPSIDFLKDFDPSVLVAESANIDSEGSLDLARFSEVNEVLSKTRVYNLEKALEDKAKWEKSLKTALTTLHQKEKELEAAKTKYLADMSSRYGHDLDWESFIGADGYNKVQELKKQMEAVSDAAKKKRDETARALKEKDTEAEANKRFALPTLLAIEMKKVQLAIAAEQKKLQEAAPLAIGDKPKTEEEVD